MDLPEHEAFRVPYAPTTGFDGLIGLEVVELTPERARARLAVREDLKQPFGLVHGGVYATIAETLASIATAAVVVPEGRVAVGLSNQTSFLRPVTGGVIEAVALRRHRGRTTWIWEVEMSDGEGRLCTLTRMTIAVRETM